ncbi:hypothetical protein LY76DRAFT_557623 [Colletotrichum caudatum]|nr:hypothetical protein LY76DRAFT_557623 [Colletotrichum caudatum]
MVYDPYTTDYQILEFPGISHTDPYHISGIDYDASSEAMFFSANSGLGFQTNGANLTGPNKVIKWDTKKMEVVFIADLAPFQEEYLNKFGHVAAGFQDMAEDSHGNSYTPTTFGGEAIAKICPDGSVEAFYLSNTTAKNATANAYLYSGLVSLPLVNKLVVTDAQQGTFVTFNTNSSSPQPTAVKLLNMPSNYTSIACDAIITPTRYPGQQVILCAEDFLDNKGAVTVFRSKDNWETAEYLGAAYNNLEGFDVVAPLQLSNNIFYIPFAANDGGSFDSKGNRSSFPFVDITEEIDRILA